MAIKLMIVDDEVDVREFAANFFKKRNVDVCTAASGEEALSKAEKKRPQIILLDISMPGIDGIETLKRLRELDGDARVVMVTGRKPEDGESAEQCKNLGAVDYIHKPLELDELEKVVMKLISELKPAKTKS